jgi:molybdenum cofactor biosynthesis enzyme MoaA
MDLLDRFGRPMRSLRISVTDRCNLRCQYCMPEPEYVWLPRENILSFEEIGSLTEAFTDEGVSRIRITGGEPLLRRDSRISLSPQTACFSRDSPLRSATPASTASRSVSIP